MLQEEQRLSSTNRRNVTPTISLDSVERARRFATRLCALPTFFTADAEHRLLLRCHHWLLRLAWHPVLGATAGVVRLTVSAHYDLQTCWHPGRRSGSQDRLTRLRLSRLTSAYSVGSTACPSAGNIFEDSRYDDVDLNWTTGLPDGEIRLTDETRKLEWIWSARPFHRGRARRAGSDRRQSLPSTGQATTAMPR